MAYTNQYARYLFNLLNKLGRVNVPPRTQIAFDSLLTSRNIDYTCNPVILSQKHRRRDIDSYNYEIEER